MPKTTTKFVCQSCAYESPKWMGRCPDCGEWASMVEETVVAVPAGKGRPSRGAGAVPVQLTHVEYSVDNRITTRIGELDRVLGGGMVPGSVVLIGGDPGIGKSTLLLQALDSLQRSGQNTLYVTGEESGAQVALRARRLGLLNSQV
ncbi:MAG: ATPase domain-containing protein, partial [Armatimonadota bacterium]